MEINKLYIGYGGVNITLPVDSRFFRVKMESGGLALPVLKGNSEEEYRLFIDVIDEFSVPSSLYEDDCEVVFVDSIDVYGTNKYIIVVKNNA